MAVLVQCPNPACKTTCSVAEVNSGGPVRCPKCLKPFVVKPTAAWQKGDTNHSQPASSANPFPVLPAEFGRYRILRLLGRGGMGAVYLAQDSQLGRQVALKVPFFNAAESPQRAERFVREARSAAVLQHPNICTVFDAGQINGRPFITMAYIAGKPLEEEIDPESPMPQLRAAEIVRKIAVALEHAHRAGIVHRDLKPANVVMAAGGEPVVMDFGLAKRVADVDPNEAKLTRDGGLLGTPSYMAPEQCRGDVAAIGPATDVYALGVMLFEMLTGRTPYTGAMSVVIGRILTSPVPPVKEFRPDVDSRLDAVCRKAMAKEPAERFPSMAELAEALGAYLKAPSAPLPAPPVAVLVQAASPVVVRSPFANQNGASPSTPASRKAKRGPVVTARPPRKKWPIIAGAAVCFQLAGLAALWAGGAFRLKTQDGTIVVENLPADAEVLVDGEKVAVKLKGDDKPIEIQVAPGKRKLEIKTGGIMMETQEVTIASGERKPIGIRLEPLAAASETPVAPTLPKEEAPDVDPDRKATEYVLSIGGVVRVNDEVDDIKAAADLPRAAFQLTVVNLFANNQVSDAGLVHFKDCKNLTGLWLGRTRVGDTGLAYFDGCKNLTQLDLGGTQVTDVGLAYFKDCKNLTELLLWGTRVSNAGLAYFKDCKNLKLLWLDGAQVTDEGLVHLKGLLGLREIHLEHTRVTDAGLEQLAGLNNLSQLHLNGTAVTDKGVAKLKAALPNCNISR